MNIAKAKRLMNEHQPTTLVEFRALGFRLRRMGCGVFRVSYRLQGLPMIVKFPGSQHCYILGRKSDTFVDEIKHTNVEVAKIKHFQTYRFLRRLMPKIYYHNKKAGVVVIKFYPLNDRRGKYAKANAMAQTLGVLIRHIAHREMRDCCGDNIRMNGNRIVFVDLGY